MSQTPAPTKLFCTSQVLSLLNPELIPPSRTVRECLSGERFWNERHADRGGAEREEQNPWRPIARDGATGLLGRLKASGDIKRLMVVCAAGYGKTTNLEWLAAMQRAAGQTPFLVPLDHPDLPGTESAFWDTFLFEDFRRSNPPDVDADLLRRSLRKAREAGRISLLMDSVDQATENGRKLLRAVVKSPHWVKCPRVVSARPHAVFKEWKWLVGEGESAWRFVRVEPLAEEQICLLLGPDGLSQAERRKKGRKLYTDLSEAGRRLLENPRHIEYVRKCAAKLGTPKPATPKPATPKPAKQGPHKYREPKEIADYTLADLKTGSHLFAGAVFHAVVAGLGSAEARLIGVYGAGRTTPPQVAENWQVTLALDLLAALAYTMYVSPPPGDKNKKATKRRPNVSRIRANRMEQFLFGRDGTSGVYGRLKRAKVVSKDYTTQQFRQDFDAVNALNVAIKHDLIDTARQGDFRWHDRTLQEFLAAWWLSRYAGAEDVVRLRGWRYDNRMREAKSLYSPLWGFLVEMPKAVRSARWFDAVGVLFEHRVTRCCEMIYRCCEMFAGMSGKERRKSDEVLAEWRREFAGMTGEVAEGVRTGIVRLECNGKLPGDTGRFMMGSPAGEAGRDGDEHYREERVQAFGIGVGPVTNGQYELFDAGHKSERRWEEEADIARHPMVTVDWWEAWCFCQWVGGRLPTEVEWEYACRGGTTTPYYWGDKLNGTQANCDGNHPYPDGSEAGPDLERTSAVGSYAEANPHPWGLVDVHGNVWEWCANWYDSEQKYRMLRGGSWNRSARDCRAAFRDRSGPANRYARSGFRVVFCLD